MDKFKLVSEYRPSGDQPEAIEGLVNGVNWGLREQTLLGVTGSGKTFTMASVIEKLNRPTLVLAHNKTLAAQLCSEFLVSLCYSLELCIQMDISFLFSFAFSFSSFLSYV